MAMLEKGQKAPDFTLETPTKDKVSLSDFRGKKVVLYFYPKDNTPGCTIEACEFRDHKEEFDTKDVVILGISKDNRDSHQRFIDKYNLNFTLLSDPNSETCRDYGVLGEKKMFGKTLFGVIHRTTFIINEEGKIAKIYPKVKVKEHIEEILADLKEL
jgi:peroxiredoxin Q/BCP